MEHRNGAYHATSKQIFESEITMQNDKHLQDSSITRIERDGIPDTNRHCDVCGDALSECYAEYNGTEICTECLKDEWDELTEPEKLAFMATACGYELKKF